MKNKSTMFCLAMATTVIVACNSNSKSTSGSDSTKQVAAEQKSEPVLPLSELKSFSGKYPKAVHLFENQVLKSRIQKLLGAKYNDFIKYWNTESPVKVENDVIETTGCEQHNCADNSYLLYIDIVNDNINIFHIHNGKIESFKEKNEIKLPTEMLKDFNITKGNIKK